MDITVVILNYFNWEETLNCIDSLQSEIHLIKHVIVVDNLSGNESLERIGQGLKERNFIFEVVKSVDEKTDKTYILFQNSKNGGYASGNNVGIRLASSNGAGYIIVLNNDIRIKPNAITKMMNCISGSEEIGCVGPVVLEDEHYDLNFARCRYKWFDHILLSGVGKVLIPAKISLKHHYLGLKEIGEKPFPVDMISGSCMLFRTSALNIAGAFDENTFLYYEEAIICEKFRQQGLLTYVVPSAYVIHKHAASVKLQPKVKILRYGLQSQYYFLTKYRKHSKIVARMIMSGDYLTFLFALIINFFSHKFLFLRRKDS
jgi:GT2 family glycosyltransferase